MVTPTLFATLPDAADLAGADPRDVEEHHPLDRLLPEQDEEPDRHGPARSSTASTARCRPRLEDLVTLPGVGRKTGNVVRSVAFGLPGLPVDTHVGRLSRRLGLTTEDDPVKVELELNAYCRRRSGAIQPADDPPRPAGLRRPHARDAARCVLEDICPSSRLPRRRRAAQPREVAVVRRIRSVAVDRAVCRIVRKPGSRHLVCSDSRDPPPGVARGDGPFHQGAVAALARITPDEQLSASLTARCSARSALAQRPLGLVDRGHDVLALGPEVRLGEAGDPLAGAVDGLGGGGELGGRRRAERYS